MHIYFSGIGGAGIGPLALVAKQAGYEVSGSDAADSSYLKYLTSQGITNIHIGQSAEKLAEVHARKPIDWFVYSSALPKTDPNHPELAYVNENGIRASKRDEFLNQILADKKLKLVAIAGTHGKTTTTAMVIWLFKQLEIPVSYSVGAKISFGDMGEFDPKSQLFVYECDEFDRNFLSFHPHTALITGIDWDHPDIYPSREEYYKAFHDFLNQCEKALLWQNDINKLGLSSSNKLLILDDKNPAINSIHLAGLVNRQNAWLVAQAANRFMGQPLDEVIGILNDFPGLSRRWEQIVPGVYSDYAHTPGKIRGALQLAHEVAGDNIVVVYEGLHNTRQHFIKDELKNLFDGVKRLYIVPSYLAREDPKLPTLAPEELKALLSEKAQAHASAARLDDKLQNNIKQHVADDDTVLALSAGGANSLDEWLRREF
jgi:UDP-N-acetylmuramate--alanine ligase